MVSLLFITLLLLLVGFMGINKKEASDQKSISSLPAEQLSVSSGEKQDFSNSELHQSIKYKREQERKKAQAKKEEKQHEKDQQEKAIYLTFDDGPSPETSQLLNVLNQYQVKATFFMLGPNIKKHPEVVNRMVDEGFGVGLHGMTHSVQQVYSSTAAPLNEMTKSQRILQKVTGVTSNFVRLPYGSIPYLTEGMRDSLHQNGFNIWDWNVDSKDWKLKDKRFVERTIQEIERLEKANETPVVLLHDKPATIKHLPKLLNYLQREGYKTKNITNEKAALTFRCAGRCHPIN
ncbi:hypothetical protein GCM10028778_04370 [Barrientosiimonas marina]